jgi:hypothetical protein
MSFGITYVTTLDLNDLPIEPPDAWKVFKRACRFQDRGNVSITIQDWRRLVPEATKEQLWENITEKIKYRDGVDEGFVKSATLISMGRFFIDGSLT